LIGLLAGASLRVSKFSLSFGVPFAKSSSQWEARVVPKEMSQTLLTNKKQGKMRPRDATNIIKQIS
jgi:hypothetical protein